MIDLQRGIPTAAARPTHGNMRGLDLIKLVLRNGLPTRAGIAVSRSINIAASSIARQPMRLTIVDNTHGKTCDRIGIQRRDASASSTSTPIDSPAAMRPNNARCGQAGVMGMRDRCRCRYRLRSRCP